MKVAAYVIEERDGRWCLLTSDGSRVLGCHDTRGEAEAQERAIEVAKHSAASPFSIVGVEIFAAGEWNGDTYTEDDLDAIVSAAKEVGFTPPLKLGHTEDKGAPAVGWIENIRRIGSKLYADLVSLPQQVYDLIRGRGFDAVSAEIYWDLRRAGKTYPRALKALALLGAEIPAVDLTPLHKFLSFAPTPDSPVRVFSTDLKLEDAIVPLGQMRSATAAEIDNIVKDVTSTVVTAIHDAFGGKTTMATKTNAAVEPDADGACPEGYTKGEDGKCHMKTEEMAVRDGEVVLSLSQIQALRQEATLAAVTELSEVRERLKLREAENAELEAARRDEWIKHRLLSLKIPAFRAYARVFYELALTAPSAKTYALHDPKKPMGAEEIVDQFVTDLNKQADVLFKTLSVNTPRPGYDPDEPDAVSAKLDYRAKKYQRQHPAVDYRQAVTAVLDADPELKESYRRS